MTIYSETDYKVAIFNKVKDLKWKRPGFSLKKLADAVPMQYTYLSKVLNQDGAHLSEDQLHEICRTLEMFADETEYLFVLRSIATTEKESRKQSLLKKAEAMRSRHSSVAAFQDSSRSEFDLGMQFMTEPDHMFVQLGLNISAYKRNPKNLCPLIGITVQRLEIILSNLRTLGYIECGDSVLEVKRVNETPVHFTPSHRVTRIMQNIMKNLATGQLMKTSEENKKSFMSLFVADHYAFLEIKAEFDKFLQKVEKLVVNAPSKAVYQVGFDLFKWYE